MPAAASATFESGIGQQQEQGQREDEAAKNERERERRETIRTNDFAISFSLLFFWLSFLVLVIDFVLSFASNGIHEPRKKTSLSLSLSLAAKSSLCPHSLYLPSS